MSYQIKSTPFFRRMVSASKRNGQLQRLKEEYERIKEFNDRTIEMKMRQVRLKRLFREIEEIKESSAQWKRRRVTVDRLKTNEEIRMETLIKAKELGKEYSKMNALVDRCASRLDTMASGAAVERMSSRIELERKARSDKRISYGNDRSRMNIQKIATAQRKPSGKQAHAGEKELNELKEKLKTRLSFGNSCSHRNLAKRVKKDSRQRTTDAASMTSLPNSQTAHSMLELNSQCHFAAGVEGIQLPLMMSTGSSQRRTTFTDLYTNSTPRQNTNCPNDIAKSEEDPHVRAKRHWRKLALIVRHRFDTLHRRNMLPTTEDTEDESEEFTLRGISNDTDLTMSPLCTKTAPPDSESDLSPGEVLLSVESLDPLDTQPLSNPTGVPATEEGSNQMDTRRRVQQYVKVFEPIVREVAQKEAFELGIERLRSIFEHRSAGSVEAHDGGAEKQ